MNVQLLGYNFRYVDRKGGGVKMISDPRLWCVAVFPLVEHNRLTSIKVIKRF